MQPLTTKDAALAVLKAAEHNSMSFEEVLSDLQAGEAVMASPVISLHMLCGVCYLKRYTPPQQDDGKGRYVVYVDGTLFGTRPRLGDAAWLADKLTSILIVGTQSVRIVDRGTGDTIVDWVNQKRYFGVWNGGMARHI